jgi:hypothetical protein
MDNKKKDNFLKNPVCAALVWSEFSKTQIVCENRIFLFSKTILIPNILDLVDLKFYLKNEIRKIAYTFWSINSIVFIDPTPSASACLMKYIYTDFGQIKHQTAFYIGDSVNEKVWLIR